MSNSSYNQSTPAVLGTSTGSNQEQSATTKVPTPDVKGETTVAYNLRNTQPEFRTTHRTRWQKTLKITFPPNWADKGWKSEYASVNKLIDHLETVRSNSFQNKSGICYELSRLCEITQMTPDELVRLKREDVESCIKKLAEALMKRTDWDRTINSVKRRLNTFFQVNGFNNKNGLGLDLHLSYHAPRTRKRKEYVPTLEEAIRMSETFGFGTRNHTIIKFYTFTGFREATGRAVLYRDIKDELESGLDNVYIPVYPEMKKIVPSACKNNIPYYGFTHKILADAMREDVKRRKEKYGTIPDNAVFFNSENSRTFRGERQLVPISSRELQLIVKEAAKNAGIVKWDLVTPTSLRKSFQSFLRNQMPDVRPDVKTEEFYQGHILPGAQDTYYDKDKIEKMRADYAKLVVFEDPVLKVLKLTAAECKIDPALLKDKQRAEIGREPSIIEQIQYLRRAISERKNKISKTTQKIVEEGELPALLADDWKVHSVLPSGRIVVTKEVDDNS